MQEFSSLQLVLSRDVMKSMELILSSNHLLLLFITDIGYIFMEVVFCWLISYRICLVVIQMGVFSLIAIEGVVNDGKCLLGWAFYYLWGDES